MNRDVMRLGFYFALMSMSVVLLFLIFKPYLGALFIALVLSTIFLPVHRYLIRKFNLKHSISALLTTLAILVIILLPLSMIGAILVQEAVDFSSSLAENGGLSMYLDEKVTKLENYINSLAPALDVDIQPNAVIVDLLEWIRDNFNAVFSGLATGLLNTFLMIIALFFFIRDGKKLRNVVVKWSPLSDKNDEGIIDKMGVAVDSVIKGSLLIAMIQGFLAGVGFAFFGAPSPVLWGFIGTIAAFIPSVGTGLVIFPMVLFLYFAVSPVAALGLLLWGIFIVGLIDNVLRPILIERGVKIHPFLILLSVFGGISFFGPIGFLAGPIVLAFVFALIDVYPKVVREQFCEKIEKNINDETPPVESS